ncbi:LysE family translocator [Taklimakanibacter deserti]|uniref:LysE family translocator n=1 Tax=Taklimakanibacter deserti TaxID=2267839 RepID=UPI000E652B5B
MQLPPGPDSMLVVARGIGQGPRTALLTTLGMTLGAGLVQLPLLALGLSGLLTNSPWAFRCLQWLGAAYLLWLGFRLLVAPVADWTIQSPLVQSPFAAVKEGMIATLLNPWPMTFMVAVLPQFLDPRASRPVLELLILGGTQKVSGAVVLSTYALAAGLVGDWVRRHPQAQLWQQRMAGIFIMSLALYMLFIERP